MNAPDFDHAKVPAECQEVREQMFLLATNDLEDDKAEAAYLHLSRCPGCREAMAEHVRLAAAMFGVLGKPEKS